MAWWGQTMKKMRLKTGKYTYLWSPKTMYSVQDTADDEKGSKSDIDEWIVHGMTAMQLNMRG